jgi:exodeoxyribonuclease-3
MKVASFNVNSLRVRLRIVLDWIEEHQPDILAVQETKVQDSDFPTEAFDKINYKYAFKGEKTYNGVAIFSKTPISNVEYGFQDEPTRLGEGAALATETIETPSRSRKDQPRLIKAETNGIVVVNTYVPQGYLPDSQKFDYKLNWFNRLRMFFENNFAPTDPILWVGDLNVAPLPIDVYDPEHFLGHVCFHPDVHKALNEVMQWGFVDVFRLHCRQSGQYTFWDFRLPNALGRNLGWRLDHIMATQPLAEKSTNSYIDKKPRLANRPSDHTPIIAEFDW